MATRKGGRLKYKPQRGSHQTRAEKHQSKIDGKRDNEVSDALTIQEHHEK
jgi:hypothetical protein